MALDELFAEDLRAQDEDSSDSNEDAKAFGTPPWVVALSYGNLRVTRLAFRVEFT